MPVKNRFGETHSEITGWRRHLHTIPELGFDVFETAKFVEDKLRSFGLEDVTTGVGRTGVVAVVKGKTDTSGRVIGLRADMDALPILEATGLDYASKTSGKMHACGHDGHTAMLLGAAQYLAETRNFDGTAIMIFQPAEEVGGGGEEMVKDGLMDRWNIQEVYGMHNMPGFDVGQFAIRAGALLASVDDFTIVVNGQGGHAARPHEAIDPNIAAAHILLGLQSIASRVVDPLKQVVVSVCGLHSDVDAHNVIPQTTRMLGTIRSLDADVRVIAEAKIKNIATATAQAYGCTADIDYCYGYPNTVNADANTEYAADAARRVAGEVITDTPPIMAAEDFSFMLEARPGAYILIGNGDGPTVHHPAYNFNDDAIPAGCSWFAEIIERRMPAG